MDSCAYNCSCENILENLTFSKNLTTDCHEILPHGFLHDFHLNIFFTAFSSLNLMAQQGHGMVTKDWAVLTSLSATLCRFYMCWCDLVWIGLIFWYRFCYGWCKPILCPSSLFWYRFNDATGFIVEEIKLPLISIYSKYTCLGHMIPYMYTNSCSSFLTEMY